MNAFATMVATTLTMLQTITIPSTTATYYTNNDVHRRSAASRPSSPAGTSADSSAAALFLIAVFTCAGLHRTAAVQEPRVDVFSHRGLDDVSIGLNAVLCVAFVDRLFVRVPSYDSDTDDSTEWLEHTSSADHHFRFIQKIVLEDASVIQLADPDRGVRLFFDARDPDAVKAYWCAGADHCVWSALASRGELRYGHGADCASFIPGLMPLQTHIDASPVVKNTRLCLAFFDKIFVRMPNNSKDGENYTRWIKRGLDMQEIPFTQSSIRDDAGLIRLTDPGRRMRVLFDARDPDAVLGYVCQAHKRTTDHCVWGMFVSDGELRYGPDADCENFREPDLEREQTRMKVIEPELRVKPSKPEGGIAIVTAGTPNLIKTSNLSAELNMRYAHAHGYAFYQYHDAMVPRSIVTWNKVAVLIDMLKRTTHEWVMWVDTDAVVTNRSIAIEDIIKAAELLKAGQDVDTSQNVPEPKSTVDLLICDDIGGWKMNTGVMLWRNTDWSMKTLQKLWAMEHLQHCGTRFSWVYKHVGGLERFGPGARPRGHAWTGIHFSGAEQNQLARLLHRDDPMRLRHHIFDQFVFNTHPTVHNDALFIIHMMGYSGKDRIDAFNHYRAKLDGLQP